jgi:hypothetical protein
MPPIDPITIQVVLDPLSPSYPESAGEGLGGVGPGGVGPGGVGPGGVGPGGVGPGGVGSGGGGGGGRRVETGIHSPLIAN